MAYTKQTWSDLPSKTTPINASRLGHIEQGIYDAAATADNASTAISAMGTAVSKNSTNAVTQNSGDLVESGAVYTAIANAKASCYKPSGDKTCAELVAGLLVQSNLGNVYNITDSGTTTSDFVGGAGKPISVGDNVAIADVGSSVYKFDLLAGMIDLSNYQTKALSAQVEGQSTVEGALGALSNADRATRQLIDDTVGFECINQLDLSELSSTSSASVIWTITKNDNGDVTAINANGKATGGNSEIGILHPLSFYKLAVGDTFLLSGSASDGGASPKDYALYGVFRDSNNQNVGSAFYEDGSADLEVTVPSGAVSLKVACLVRQNKTVNVNFYPMIRKAVYANLSNYVPYHSSVDSCKADISAIGDDESGRTTASRQYSAGEYFYKDGQNCRTKTGVASGETWTLDTNYEVKSIDTVLNNLNKVVNVAVTPKSNYTLTNNSIASCNNKIVTISLAVDAHDYAIGNNYIVEVQTGYRPSKYIYAVGVDSASGTPVLCFIDTNGSISVSVLTALTNATIRVSFTYTI